MPNNIPPLLEESQKIADELAKAIASSVVHEPPLLIADQLIKVVASFLENQPTSNPTNRLVRWPEVQKRTGLSRSHIYNLIAKGLFPAPLKLVPGGRASAFVESKVDEWMRQRIEASNSSKAA